MTGQPVPDDERRSMARVDANPDAHRATESDEFRILQAEYGDPDGDGVYRGEEAF